MTEAKPVVIHKETIPISRESPMKHRGEIHWQGLVYRYEYVPVALRLVIWCGFDQVYRDDLHSAVKKHYARKP